MQNLAGLDRLTGLTSLTLNVNFSQVQTLAGLDKLAKLKTLELDVPASLDLDDLGGMKDKRQITKLMVHALAGDRLHVPTDCKSVSVIFD